MTADPLAFALEYAGRGWAVLPLHSVVDGKCTCGKDPCTSPGKHPRPKNGVKDATVNPDRIRSWWGLWPDSNVGIATGLISNLAVVDVDTKSGGMESLAELQLANGPVEGWQAQTGGGGSHFYFAAPPEQSIWKNSTGKIAPGIDTRGDGGFVVAPPSIHASGNTYTWTAEADAASVEKESVPPPLPGWVLNALLGRTKPAPQKLLAAAQPTREMAENLIVWAQKKVDSGQGRNEAGFDLACQLRDAGFTQEEMTETMAAWARLAPAKDHAYTPEEAANSLKSALQQPARDPLPGQSALEAVQISTQPLVSGLPVRLSEAFREVEPPITWIWEPIIPAGGLGSSSISMIASPGGHGKSTLVIQLGLMLAAGEPLFGEGKVHRKHKVMFLQAEGNRTMTKARIRCAIHELGFDSDDLDFYIQPREYEFSISRTLPTSLEAIRPDVCVLDTVGLFHPGDENSNTEIKKNVMIPLMMLSRQYGTAFILIHHQNKPNESREGRYKIRGASAFVDDVDLAIRMEHPKGMTPSIRELIFDKIRYGPAIVKPWDLVYQSETATFRRIRSRDELEGFKSKTQVQIEEARTGKEQDERRMALAAVAKHPGQTAAFLGCDGPGRLWQETKTRNVLNALCLGDDARLEITVGGAGGKQKLYWLKGTAPARGWPLDNDGSKTGG